MCSLPPPCHLCYYKPAFNYHTRLIFFYLHVFFTYILYPSPFFPKFSLNISFSPRTECRILASFYRVFIKLARHVFTSSRFSVPSFPSCLCRFMNPLLKSPPRDTLMQQQKTGIGLNFFSPSYSCFLFFSF